MTKKRWASEDVDQPWNTGEAIGLAMRALFSRRFVSLVLPPLVVELLLLVTSAGIGLIVGQKTALAAFVLQYLKKPSLFSEPVPPPREALAFVSIVGAILAMFAGGLMLAFVIDAALAAIR